MGEETGIMPHKLLSIQKQVIFNQELTVKHCFAIQFSTVR